MINSNDIQRGIPLIQLYLGNTVATPPVGSYTYSQTESFDVVAGENSLPHTFGREPKNISVKLPGSPSLDYPISGNWWADETNPTTVLVARFDADYTGVSITFYY